MRGFVRMQVVTGIKVIYAPEHSLKIAVGYGLR